MKFKDDFLTEIDAKVASGERISDAEAVRLFQTDDLTGLGRVANRANSMKNGDQVFFNINRHMNPTNLCINHCQFCAFYRKNLDEPGAYELTIPEILEKLKGDVAAGATEVHIVGGLHPSWQFEDYVEIVCEIHRHYPSLHIKAFTCVEIDHFSTISGKPLEEVFEILKDAGFAEAPSPPTVRPPTVRAVPALEISIGPPRRTLALYKSVKANWVPDKFMLELDGTKTDVLEIMESIRDSFKKHRYPLDQICHYYEITFPPQPVDIDSFIEKLRQKFDIEMNLGEEKLKPFTISLSNFDMPVTREKFYKWLHVRIEPDVNASQERVLIEIIKREMNVDQMIKFLLNMKDAQIRL